MGLFIRSVMSGALVTFPDPSLLPFPLFIPCLVMAHVPTTSDFDDGMRHASGR